MVNAVFDHSFIVKRIFLILCRLMVSKNKIEKCAGAVTQKMLRESKSSILTKLCITNQATNKETKQPTNELTEWGIMLSISLILPHPWVSILDLNPSEKKMLTIWWWIFQSLPLMWSSKIFNISLQKAPGVVGGRSCSCFDVLGIPKPFPESQR